MQRIARIEDTSYLPLEGGLSVGKNGLFLNVLAAGAGRTVFRPRLRIYVQVFRWPLVLPTAAGIDAGID
jgi:hypothetical protein